MVSAAFYPSIYFSQGAYSKQLWLYLFDPDTWKYTHSIGTYGSSELCDKAEVVILLSGIFCIFFSCNLKSNWPQSLITGALEVAQQKPLAQVLPALYSILDSYLFVYFFSFIAAGKHFVVQVW